MQSDIFGDLSQQNGVLVSFREVACHGSLDEHQAGLARILRLKQNPHLINAALEYSNCIERPSEILIAEALNILVSHDLPIHTKALAAKVLGNLIFHCPAKAVSGFNVERVIESMIHVLSGSQAPVVKQLDLAPLPIP